MLCPGGLIDFGGVCRGPSVGGRVLGGLGRRRVTVRGGGVVRGVVGRPGTATYPCKPDVDGQLRKDDGKQNDGATGNLTGARDVTEEDHPAEQSEHGFERHDERGNRRGARELLTDDLRGIADARGADAEVEQMRQGGDERRGGEVYARHGGLDQGTQDGEDAGDGELDERQTHAVRPRGKDVNQGDVQPEQGGGGKQNQVAGGKAAARTVTGEQVRPAEGDGDADPHVGCRHLAAGEPPKGHEHHIERGEEGRLAR